jgi:hypothetical protein
MIAWCFMDIFCELLLSVILCICTRFDTCCFLVQVILIYKYLCLYVNFSGEYVYFSDLT